MNLKSLLGLGDRWGSWLGVVGGINSAREIEQKIPTNRNGPDGGRGAYDQAYYHHTWFLLCSTSLRSSRSQYQGDDHDVEREMNEILFDFNFQAVLLAGHESEPILDATRLTLPLPLPFLSIIVHLQPHQHSDQSRTDFGISMICSYCQSSSSNIGSRVHMERSLSEEDRRHISSCAPEYLI